MTRRFYLGALFAFAYLLIAFAVFGAVWVNPTQTVVGSPNADVLSMFYPLRAFANQELQSGRLPLWNPFVLCGHPFHGEGQGAVFYPLNLALAGLMPALSMNLFAVLHFAAAGIFLYFFLKACGLSGFSAFVGGLIYMLSSAPVSRFYAGHFTIIPFLALVPAYLWAWQAWCNRRSVGPLLAGALFFGCMILAGYPQLLLYGAFYFGWLALIEVMARWKAEGRRALWALGFVAGVIALGSCVGAVQLLPSYAFAGESFRQQASYDFIASFSFAPENFITLVAPRFFGGLGEEGLLYWGRNYLWEMWIYIGILPLALAMASVINKRSRLVAAHASAVVVFLVLALGKHTPLHRMFYEVVPFFDYFRGSSKFSFFVVISLCTLAAVGLNGLLEADAAVRKKWLRTVGACLGILIVAGLILFFMFDSSSNSRSGILARLIQWRIEQGDQYIPQYIQQGPPPQEAWKQARPELLRLIAIGLAGLGIMVGWRYSGKRSIVAAGAILVIVLADLLPFVLREFPVSSIHQLTPDAEFIYEIKNDRSNSRVLAAAYDRNAFIPYRIETPLGYVGNMTARYNNYLTAVTGLPRNTSMATTFQVSQQLFYPNVAHLILGQKQDVPQDALTEVIRADQRVLYRVNKPVPRVYFSQRGTFYSSVDSALDAIEGGQASPMRGDLIESGEGLHPVFGAPTVGEEAEIIDYSPRQVLIRYRSFGQRMLVFTDDYASGWKCLLDGVEELKIYPVNIAFRGVVLPQGNHEVIFLYTPPMFRLGAAVSMASPAILVILLTGNYFRERRAKKLL